MSRPREDNTEETLLEDLRYLWESQGPAGRNRGVSAMEELLYRWGGYLTDDHFELEYSDEIIDGIGTEPAIATIAMECKERGYDPKRYGLVIYKEE